MVVGAGAVRAVFVGGFVCWYSTNVFKAMDNHFGDHFKDYLKEQLRGNERMRQDLEEDRLAMARVLEAKGKSLPRHAPVDDPRTPPELEPRSLGGDGQAQEHDRRQGALEEAPEGKVQGPLGAHQVEAADARGVPEATGPPRQVVQVEAGTPGRPAPAPAQAPAQAPAPLGGQVARRAAESWQCSADLAALTSPSPAPRGTCDAMDNVRDNVRDNVDAFLGQCAARQDQATLINDAG